MYSYLSNSVRLFLDMDGVLCDFMRGMCDAHNKPNPFHDKATKCGPEAWDLECLIGMDREEFWSKESYEFWAHMPPMPDLELIRNAIKNSLSWKQVCILTHPTEHPDCVRGKTDWIKRYMPEVGDQILFGCCKHFCGAPGHILIDDKDSNIEHFRQAGGTAILYPRKWNARHEHVAYPGYDVQFDLSLAILDASWNKFLVMQNKSTTTHVTNQVAK